VTRAAVGVKLGALVFAAAVLQATILGAVDLGGGRPDLLLVVVVAIALARGTTVGALAGFAAGLLFDLATFGTLGVTSLLLTLAGYWIGRYGETTGRGRTHAPLLSVLVMTVAYAVAAYVLHTILGDAVSARVALLDAQLAALVGNLLLAVPVYALVGRLIRSPERLERVPEVRLLG
jgi:rod shape-determining protein MreD